MIQQLFSEKLSLKNDLSESRSVKIYRLLKQLFGITGARKLLCGKKSPFKIIKNKAPI